jgi:glycerol-3-phosphate acyltransferase PlsX
VLKTAESSVTAIGHWLKDELRSSLMSRIGACFLKRSLGKMRNKMDPQTYGGAPLLGVNGVCIITHGASKAPAIYHAVRVASESVHQHLNDLVVKELEEMGAAR